MAEGHIKDTDHKAQELAAQLDATQQVLNVAEHLPMFTEQLIEDVRAGCATKQIEQQLVCLHHTLLSVSRKVGETRLVRASSILCPQNNDSKQSPLL